MSAPVRALAPDEAAAFRLIRLLAAETSPYFMAALFATTPVAAPELGTFAVDAAWRLYLDPELLTGDHAWPQHEAAGVLVHEVGHLIRDHAGRARDLPQPYQPGAWNFACDAEINDDLLAAGIALPAGVVTPAALGCEPAALAKPVLSGPHLFNFLEIAALLRNAGALEEVEDAQGLAVAVQRLFELPQDAQHMAQAGLNVMLANQGALQRLLDGLARLLAR